jgi:type VI secretion system protein
MSAGLLGKMRRRQLGGAPPSVTASILAHLTQLLNARQGDSAIDPAYGLPDLTDLAHRIPEGIPVLQRSIAETIQRYEPRLRRVNVSSSSRDDTSLHFEVQAELVTGGAVRFRTEVSACGHVSVS